MKNLKDQIKDAVEQNDLIPAISILLVLICVPVTVLVGWAFSMSN